MTLTQKKRKKRKRTQRVPKQHTTKIDMSPHKMAAYLIGVYYPHGKTEQPQ